jgi:hypothetical protein
MSQDPDRFAYFKLLLAVLLGLLLAYLANTIGKK